MIGITEAVAAKPAIDAVSAKKFLLFKFNFCLVASRDGQKFINLPSVDYKTPNKRYLKTLYSAVSFGSESRTINNKKINFENLVNKKFITRSNRNN